MMIGFSSCDFCDDTTNPGGTGETILYMTLLPSQDLNTTVFEYDIDNTDFTNVIADGIIYSPPSDGNKLLYLKTENNKRQMWLFDLNNGQDMMLEQSNSLFDIAFPKISKDGKIAVFDGGEGRLFSYDITDKAIDKITSQYLSDYAFSISPNGKYIAFFEMFEDKTYKLVVVDSDNLDNIIYSNTFSNIELENRDNQAIEWSNDASMLVFSYNQNEKTFIYLASLIDASMKIEVSSNLGAKYPQIAPDNNYLSFVSNTGELWVRSLNKEEPVYSKIVERNDIPLYISQHIWSNNMKEIYYIQELDFGNGQFYEQLCKVEFEIENSHVQRVNNNAVCNNIVNLIKKP